MAGTSMLGEPSPGFISYYDPDWHGKVSEKVKALYTGLAGD